MAYFAPISFGDDNRYVRFVDTVGDAACRARLSTFVRTVLERRDRLAPLWVQTYGAVPFTRVSFDKALETAVLELPFVFWQYLPPAACASIPGPEADDAHVLEVLEAVSPVVGYSDPYVTYYGAYYFQAAMQLGYPRVDVTPYTGLLRYSQHDVPEVYASAPVPQRRDRALAHQMASWVWQHGERMLFVNGALDPWSATPYQVHPSVDGLTVTVPGGNHSARLSQLLPEDRARALQRLGAWMGVDLGSGPAAARAAAAETGAALSTGAEVGTLEDLPAYDVAAGNPRRLPVEH